MSTIRFYVPCQRDEELVKGERKRLLRGVASTERTDKHDEEVLLSGMDFGPYLESGHLNWDHLPGPLHILGKPLEAEIVSDGSKLRKGISGPAFWHLCELYDTEPGRAAWDLMKAEKDDSSRNYGFSVEGAILQTKGSKLLKTRVDDVALTPKPANPDTFAEFAKSLSTQSAEALVLQQIDDNKTPSETAAKALNGVDLDELLWGKCEHGCYDKHGRFIKGSKSAYYHLVKCHGHDEDTAIKFVKNLAKSGIF